VNALDGGMRQEDLEASLIASDEYFANSGSDGNTFVANVYRDVLGREPDEAGFNYWTGALAGGMARADLAREFIASDENRGPGSGTRPATSASGATPIRAGTA
jgi:hypothetical protein